MHVLLAEDNEINQKVALYMLKGEGFSVKVAANGIQAVSASSVEAFDLILMDVHMPEMNGLDATRAIREREADSGRHTPIIAMTARALDEDRSDCEEVGMDGYVSKPFVPNELLAEINRVLTVGPSPEAGGGSSPKWAAGGTMEGDGAPVRGHASVPAAFDPSRLQQMLDGDHDKIDEFIRHFVQEFPEQIRSLERALLEDDALEMEHRAHNLKGTAANLGFTRICEAAGELEDLVRNGKLDEAGEQIAVLRFELGLMTAE